jgi:hypothetical protein
MGLGNVMRGRLNLIQCLYIGFGNSKLDLFSLVHSWWNSCLVLGWAINHSVLSSVISLLSTHLLAVPWWHRLETSSRMARDLPQLSYPVTASFNCELWSWVNMWLLCSTWHALSYVPWILSRTVGVEVHRFNDHFWNWLVSILCP